MGGFQNFAISFTIISILAGCLTSYYIAFQWGGPVAVTWGLAASRDLLHHRLARDGRGGVDLPNRGRPLLLGVEARQPGLGLVHSWFNLVGQVAVTAAIGYGLAILATSLLDLLFNYPNTSKWIFVTYTVVMAIAVLINMFRVSITAALNTFSAWWHMAGVLVIVGILIIVPDNHQSLGYVFGETINNSGFSGQNFGDLMFFYVFGIGLLMAQYTITGFDASAHLAEETNQASRMAAIGMVMSVVVSVVFGFLLLLAVTFAIPDTKGVIDAGGYAVTYIWETSMSRRWAEFLLLIAVVAQMFCLTASVTSASRMMYAFSRDGAVPGSIRGRGARAHSVGHPPVRKARAYGPALCV